MGCLIYFFALSWHQPAFVSCCGSIGSGIALHAAVLTVALCHGVGSGVAHCAMALHFLSYRHSFVVCVAVI